MGWKEKLTIPADLAAEIDQFESEIALRKQGKLDEIVALGGFAFDPNVQEHRKHGRIIHASD